jgi:hypothetical protein
MSRSETCLCHNGYSCQTCRLQKKVKTAESKLHEAQSELQKKLKTAESKLHEAQSEYAKIFKATCQLTLLVSRYKNLYGELEPQDSEGDQAEGEDAGEDEEDEEEEGEENKSEGPDALEHALDRAATAELENGPLHVEIARLKRENKNLRNKARNQRNPSTSPMTQMTNSTRPNPLASGASDDSQSDTGYPQHARGGKTRPGGAANSGAEPAGSVGGATGGMANGKSGYATTTKGPEKTAKKRQRDTHKEDEDEDSEEPPFKRHRSTAPASGRAVEGRKGGRKTGANTCGTEGVAKKKYQEDSDHSDDESFNPGPKSRRSCLPRNAGRRSIAPIANQTIAKTGRRTNNSQAGFLDTFGLSSLTSNSRKTLGVFRSGSATNNSMSGFTDDESDATTSDIPQVTFSSAVTTATILNSSTPANPTQAAATSRKAPGWTDRELQALIALVRAHRNAPVGLNGKKPEVLHDVRLFELMSRQLRAQGINRSAGACKNEWNRRGRQASGIDNRKVPNPRQMATSIQ